VACVQRAYGFGDFLNVLFLQENWIMKTRAVGKTLLASTVMTAAALAGSALAAGQTPFTSQTTQQSTMQLAEMSCGGNGACGGNVKQDTKKDDGKTDSKS
jgi:hypothetical protein